MKTCTKCQQLKPLELFSKNKNYRDGLQNQCKQCYSDQRRVNRDKYLIAHIRWIEQNRDKINKKSRDRYANDANYRARRNQLSTASAKKNPEKTRERKKRYCQNNPEAKYLSQRNWRQKNKSYANALTRARQAAIAQRVPIWITSKDQQKIQQYYIKAQIKSEQTGEKWVVDHIIPLRGKYVSGLHVPQNLQVIDRSTNSRKSNKFDIDKEWRT